MAAILLCINLNAKALNAARQKNCSKVVFVRKLTGLAETEGLQLVNANTYERESYHYTFGENKKKLKAFSEAAPAFFQNDSIDLLEAINKDYFWMTRYEGMLIYTAEKIKKQGESIFFYSPDENALKNILAAIRLCLLYLAGILRPSPRARPADKHFRGKKFGFYVENRFQREYYSGLAAELGEENSVFLSNHSSKADFANDPGIENRSGTPYVVVPQRLPLSTIIKGCRLFGVKGITQLWFIRQHLVSAMHSISVNFHSGIKAFFLVAQENTGFGNIISAMGKQHGKLIVNSHNGLKSADAYNQDNHFDIWVCWDEKMGEMLSRECFIEEGQLKTAGHLMEDRAYKHVYKGSYLGFVDPKENKKIISLFSINDHPKSKWEVIRSVIDFTRSRDDLKLIIRLHPSEGPEEWDHLAASVDKSKVHIVRPKPTDNKDQLYDQLLISDAAIVFGSTVAVECRWFGVPCITFEERERSILYMVDNEHIIHISSSAKLNETLNDIIKKGKKGMAAPSETVARRIRRIVEEKMKGIQAS